MKEIALIAGSSGIVGSALASLLVQQDWEVHGLARRPLVQKGVRAVSGDFEDPASLAKAVADLRPTHVFIAFANFYYAQEDEVFAAAARDGFAWSIHRPHSIIGKAVRNAMNMGTTLAVYASICCEIGRPFYFPGSLTQWISLTRHDRRAIARPSSVVGHDDGRCVQSSLQRGQRRRLQMEMNVGPHRGMVRPGTAAFHRRHAPLAAANGQ